MHWYYNFLVRRPYWMVLAIAVLCMACVIVSLTSNTMPDFSDPTLGFEARGTDIGQRLAAWENLRQETSSSGSLVSNPNDLPGYDSDAKVSTRKRKVHHNRNRKRKNKRKQKNQTKKSNIELSKKILIIKNHDTNKNNTGADRSPTQWNGDNGIFRDYEITNESWSMDQINRSEHIEYGRNMTFVDEDDRQEKIQTKKSTWRNLKEAPAPAFWGGTDGINKPIDGYFCDSPARDYSHFVVERIGPNATDSLFDLNALLAMCQLQEQITAVTSYEEYCQKEFQSAILSGNCCRPWSLANYAALFANKSSCFDLNVDDVTMLQNVLVLCFEYFYDLKLSNDCNEFNRCYAPAECTRHNIVYNILHFLTDYNFINNNSNVYLKYSMIFVPVVRTTNILPLFREWENTDLKNELVQVAAMDLGLENELFNKSLVSDGWLILLGGAFVMTCIWLYTGSIFITAMSFVAVAFSLGLAYFIYTLVFEMSFFPYMNLLAVVVIIGADNAFVFVKIWECVLAERFTKTSIVTTHSLSTTVESEHTETLQNLMALTFRHAALSMFVSSLTTACAFYASYTSSITAIKCFGVFSGTVVIANYLLMMTWLPASVSIMERISASTSCSKLQVQRLLLMFNKSINKFCKLFESIVVKAVMNYSLLWIIVFAITGISSAVIVLYSPGLQLPESSHFQLLVSKHPFEVYNTKMKSEFWFEKSMTAFENFKMPLRFVWGIQPIDDGDYTNPFSHGNLYYDNNFNISTKAAQVWLLEFCQRLRQQSFYQPTFGLLLPNCFIENFISFMSRMCIDGMDKSDRTPCCDISEFPYEPHVFELCLPRSISSLYATPIDFFIPGVAGPKFYAPSAPAQQDADTSNESFEDINSTIPLVKALVIEFESNVSYTANYASIKSFVEIVEQWFLQELTAAPVEMSGGWFISELKFFDVQHTLSRDTIIAIIVAMSVSLVVLLLVTLNVLVSIYAVITVTFTIFTTVAILIVLDWKLNILESVAVSTAIGLAVDYSLHYGIHYRLSPTCERIAATQFALSRIIGPTAMAALTTGMAGALMLASSVLPYIQIGIFLVVITSVSWLYATFFLMSLLKMGGPQYGFMQFSYPKIKKRPPANGSKYYERKQSQVIASEQLLTPSSSANVDLINSETHELESITSSSLIKTISGTECCYTLDYQHSFNKKKNRSNDREHHVDCPNASVNYKCRPSIESAAVELTTTAVETVVDASKFYKTLE